MEFLSRLLLLAAEAPAVDPNASGADLTGGGQWMQSLALFIPLVLLYVILILPQRKKEKKQREIIAGAVAGDQIVTFGGITGKIVNIKDDEVTFETSAERTKITIKKWAIKDVIKPVEG